MERQSKGSRGLEAYCKGGQGPPRAVAPPKKKKKKKKKKKGSWLNTEINILRCMVSKTSKNCSICHMRNNNHDVSCVLSQVIPKQIGKIKPTPL